MPKNWHFWSKVGIFRSKETREIFVLASEKFIVCHNLEKHDGSYNLPKEFKEVLTNPKIMKMMLEEDIPNIDIKSKCLVENLFKIHSPNASIEYGIEDAIYTLSGASRDVPNDYVYIQNLVSAVFKVLYQITAKSLDLEQVESNTESNQIMLMILKLINNKLSFSKAAPQNPNPFPEFMEEEGLDGAPLFRFHSRTDIINSWSVVIQQMQEDFYVPPDIGYLTSKKRDLVKEITGANYIMEESFTKHYLNSTHGDLHMCDKCLSTAHTPEVCTEIMTKQCFYCGDNSHRQGGCPLMHSLCKECKQVGHTHLNHDKITVLESYQIFKLFRHYGVFSRELTDSRVGHTVMVNNDNRFSRVPIDLTRFDSSQDIVEVNLEPNFSI